MQITDNAGEAIDSSREGIESLLRWFDSNWEAITLGLTVAAGIVALMLGLRWVGSRLISRDPECTRWTGVFGRVLQKTTMFFMVATALEIVATYSAGPSRIEQLTDILFIIAFALQGAIWARELILGSIGRRVSDDAESTLANAQALIRVLVSVALFAIAIIVILDNLGVNVTALVAGLGIGGIAIGLAAQGIFSDLFAALAILFDRPFRRGDTIRYDTTVGTVEKIGLKTTRMRSLSGEQVIMANTKLLEREIHNLAEGHSRRTVLNFGLTYQTPVEKLEQVRDLARAAVEAQSGCTFVRCAMTGFGASSLDHELLFDNATLDIDLVAADRTKVMMQLIRDFATHGIEFAYPTQTTFTAAPDGTLVMPYSTQPLVLEPADCDSPDDDADRKA